MRKKHIYTGLLLGVIIILLLTSDIALAADSIGDILGGGSKSMTASDFSDKVIDFGKDINEGTSFRTEFQKIFLGMNTVFRSIITILTVAAGAMIAFGIEDGKKTVWQFMLGIGLAYNFGVFLFEVFGNTGILMSVDDIAAAHKGTSAAAEILKNSKENGNDDILSEIMAVYSGTIINNGMPVLQAIALRMTIALAALEGGYKIAMDLYSGDKIKFMLTYVFKAGFFCFLIMEWLNIGQALSGFFQAAGFMAAGETGFSTADPTSVDADKTFRPDSIWHNAWAFLELCLNGKGASDEAKNVGFGFVDAVSDKGVFSVAGNLLSGAILEPIVEIIATLVIVGIMLFIAVEMFVARIEFYTMLMLSVVFLPFGVTERLAFLSNSAISLMFNSGAKMMVICFLQVMIAKIFSAYFIKLEVNPYENFSILCQIIIMCAFFAYLTKKIPDLVSSFLNGSPALSGGGMISQASGMARQAASVAGAVATGGAALGGMVAGAGVASQAAKEAYAASGKAPTMMSSLKNSTAGMMARGLAMNALGKNPITQAASRGARMMIGDDGKLLNPDTNFMDGVQRLAGLEKRDNVHAPRKDSIFSDAADPSTKRDGTGNGNDTPPGGPPGGGGSPNKPTINPPKGYPGEDTTAKPSQEKGDGGSGGRGIDGKDGKDGQSAQVAMPTPNGMKEKETIRENTNRSESQHTEHKDTKEVPSQNAAEKAGSAQASQIMPTSQSAAPAGGGAGTGNAASQPMPGKAEASGTVTAGNGNKASQQIGGGAPNTDSSGNKSGSSMSDMGNFKRK